MPNDSLRKDENEDIQHEVHRRDGQVALSSIDAFSFDPGMPDFFDGFAGKDANKNQTGVKYHVDGDQRSANEEERSVCAVHVKNSLPLEEDCAFEKEHGNCVGYGECVCILFR